MDPLAPRRAFAELVRKGEPAFDMAEAALAVAREEYPLLDPAPYLSALDGLAARARAGAGGRDAAARIAALNRVLFDEEGYAGNQDQYYDPRNSFLNEVMDRKTGIPISLGLLYMETARRAGLAVEGVGLPGHFIVRAPLDAGASRLIDPFHGGSFLSEEECAERVRRIYGGRMPFRRDYLQPVGPFAVLSRLLYNLKNIYVESKSYAKAHAVISKLVLLNPDSWEEVRDRGLALYQLKQYVSALGDLEAYLKNAPRAPDRADVLKLAKIIGRKIKR